jgi:hypothetical protein
MSQTVTFSGGSFDIPASVNQLTATPSSFNSAAGSPSYTIQNQNKTVITGLGFQDNSPGGLTLNIASQSRTTATGSTFSLGDANDTLVIGGSANNNFFMGNGNNNLTFQFGSTNDTVNFGNGSDTLVFGNRITNTLVQLTTDSSVDTIKIAQSTTPVTGLRITGATDIDVLFIGSTRYNYSSTAGEWINPDNSADRKNFS